MEYQKLDYDGFDWDNGNISKIKARISIEQVENLFKQKMLSKLDKAHSTPKEERFIAIAETFENRVLFVAYTMRTIGNKNLLRPISARYANQKERGEYEKNKKAFQKS